MGIRYLISRKGTNYYELKKGEQSKEAEDVADELGMCRAFKRYGEVVNHGYDENTVEEI
jgi:hypothetical protein